MIFNKFLLGLPPTKVNIDSELFSLGLTREMIKFCIHYIIARLYYLCSKIYKEVNSSGKLTSFSTNLTINYLCANIMCTDRPCSLSLSRSAKHATITGFEIITGTFIVA